MAGKPSIRQCLTAVFISLSVSPCLAGLDQCRLEIIDPVARTAAVRCADEIRLLAPGDTFMDYSVNELSARHLTLSNAEGVTVLWYVAEDGKRSRVRRILPASDQDEKQQLMPAASSSSSTLVEMTGQQ